MKKIISFTTMAMALFSFCLFGLLFSTPVFARGDVNIEMSPMRESVVLNPGDTYKSSFSVSNPGYSEDDLSYHVNIQPFYVDENYNPVFTNVNDTGWIAEWITIVSGEKGTIAPNESTMVEFEINVPKDAPAGGQYASIGVVTDINTGDTGGVNIGEGLSINHVVMAEITGNTISAGDILETNVSSFLLGGKVTGYSTVENTGNVHGLATYTMQIEPAFSDEVVFSNADMPETHYILPGRTYFNEMVWQETPMIGMYDVFYTVEFQGIKSEVSRLVIICPWWLLVVVILGLILLVIRIVTLIKVQKGDKKPLESEAAK